MKSPMGCFGLSVPIICVGLVSVSAGTLYSGVQVQRVGV